MQAEFVDTSILHVILPLIKPLIRSSSVLAITTKSLTYNNFHGKANLNCRYDFHDSRK